MHNFRTGSQQIAGGQPGDEESAQRQGASLDDGKNQWSAIVCIQGTG